MHATTVMAFFIIKNRFKKKRIIEIFQDLFVHKKYDVYSGKYFY